MKYRHHGYRDDDYRRDREKKRPYEKRGPREITTREATAVLRCWQCGSQEPAGGTEILAACSNCKADLHCCRSCVHFDPGARFQCRKPIEKAYRDKTIHNDCTVFEPRQVLDATGRRASGPGPLRNGKQKPREEPSNDPRDAFHNLFNK